MKIVIYSDLHNEISEFNPPNIEADVIVLAGDIFTGTKGIEWAQNKFKDTPVLYVFGNHEYYGNHFPGLREKASSLAKNTSVKVLENNEIIIGNVRFLGCTLWTDFAVNGMQSAATREALACMNDYRKIRTGSDYRKLRPIDTIAEHHFSVLWLREKLADPFDGKTVVITHHSPVLDGLNDRRPINLLNGAYASDMDALIEEHQPDVWVFGHTHKKVDMMVHQTQVVSNPRGYSQLGEDTGFEPGFMLDL